MPSTRTSSSTRSARTTRSTRRSTAPADAFLLLEANHRRVKGLFNQFKKSKKQGADDATKSERVKRRRSAMTNHPVVAMRRRHGARASGDSCDCPRRRESQDLAAMREILVALPVGIAPWQMIAVRLVHVAHS